MLPILTFKWETTKLLESTAKNGNEYGRTSRCPMDEQDLLEVFKRIN